MKIEGTNYFKCDDEKERTAIIIQILVKIIKNNYVDENTKLDTLQDKSNSNLLK